MRSIVFLPISFGLKRKTDWNFCARAPDETFTVGSVSWLSFDENWLLFIISELLRITPPHFQATIGGAVFLLLFNPMMIVKTGVVGVGCSLQIYLSQRFVLFCF